MRQNILGIFFHGCGHMWIAFDKNNGEGGRMGLMTGLEITRNNPSNFAITFFAFFLFWYFLTIAGGLKDNLGNFPHVLLIICVEVF